MTLRGDDKEFDVLVAVMLSDRIYETDTAPQPGCEEYEWPGATDVTDTGDAINLPTAQ